MSEFVYCKARVDFLNSSARMAIVSAGRSSGKSVYAREVFKRRLTQRHPLCKHPVYAWCMPTYSQARRIAWPKFIREIPKEWLLGKPNKSEMRIDTIFGSTMYLIGLDSPQRLEGEHYCGIAVDEMSDVKPEAITLSILPALNAYWGWLMVFGVPKRKGVGAAFFRQLCEGDYEGLAGFKGGIEYFHWTSEDIYSPEQLAMFRALMTEKDYREQFMATWESAAGLVYYAFERGQNVFTDNRYDPNAPIWVSSDFNVSPMSWVICQGDDVELRVIDEISLEDTNTQRTLDELYRRWGHHKGGWDFYGDAAGRARHTCASDPSITDYTIIQNDHRFADHTGRVRVHYPRSNSRIADKVASVNAMLRSANGEVRLLISSRCTKLIRDMEYVSYRKDSREIDESNHELVHMSDALGYIIQYKYPLRRIYNDRIQREINACEKW